MRHNAVTLIAVVLIATAPSCVLAAQRTFVSGSGSDSNACSPIAPCRSFATALLNTAANGEIIVQDSAGYGPVTIGQSVAIIAPPGVYGGVSVSSGSGITINGAGINVTLKGLTINGQGGATGIDFQSIALGSNLRVENVEIANMTGNGLTASAGSSEVLVIDTIVRDNGGNGIETMGSTTVTVDRVRFDRNANGIRAHDGPVLSVANSVFANSTNSGVRLDVAILFFSVHASIDNCTLTGAGNEVVYIDAQGPNSTVDVAVSRSTLSGNQNGVGVNASGPGSTATATLKDNVISKNSNKGVYVQFAGATAILAGNTITGNVTGVQSLSSGALKSFGNNGIYGNGADVNPAPAIVPNY